MCGVSPFLNLCKSRENLQSGASAHFKEIFKESFMNIKTGDTVLFQGLSSTVLDVFNTGYGKTFYTIYNKFDGEIEVTQSEITLEENF